jgi:phospholipase/carboxylesterase
MNLHYITKEPQSILEKNPLLILIHGYGSNEEDLFSFADHLPNNAYIISLRAPYDMMYGSYAWYAINFDANQNKFSDVEQAKTSIQLISNFITNITNTLPIDKENVTLIGFSQGCILSLATAFQFPKKIKNIVGLSGYLNEDLIPNDFNLKELQNINFFVSHGTDDQVIPFEWAKKIVPYFEKNNIPLTFKDYPVGHGVAPQNFWDFKNWLSNKI